jgi:outer membrane biosynthesis protein TonB
MAAADRPVGRAALAAALVLHLAVFAALTLSPKPRVIPTGDAVPITVVSHEPSAAPAKSAPAPVPEDAQTETPTPEAPPPEPPPPPAPQPRPAPPRPPKPAPAKPAPAPKPTPKPAPKAPVPPPPKPAPAKPARAAKSAAAPSLDLDALQASLAKSTHPAPPRPSFAARGPTRVQAAPQTATAAGVSHADQVGLSQLLNRLWNPNCSVEGGDAVLVTVTFAVGSDGRLVGRVSAAGRESSDPVVAAAARRAIDAVHAVEPYQPVYRGAQFRINFDAKTACANR